MENRYSVFPPPREHETSPKGFIRQRCGCATEADAFPFARPTLLSKVLYSEHGTPYTASSRYVPVVYLLPHACSVRHGEEANA